MPITSEYNGEFITTNIRGMIELPDLLAHADEIAALEAKFPVTPPTGSPIFTPAE